MIQNSLETHKNAKIEKELQYVKTRFGMIRKADRIDSNKDFSNLKGLTNIPKMKAYFNRLQLT